LCRPSFCRWRPAGCWRRSKESEKSAWYFLQIKKLVLTMVLKKLVLTNFSF
jgi:hypothetical protein